MHTLATIDFAQQCDTSRRMLSISLPFAAGDNTIPFFPLRLFPRGGNCSYTLARSRLFPSLLYWRYLGYKLRAMQSLKKAMLQQLLFIYARAAWNVTSCRRFILNPSRDSKAPVGQWRSQGARASERAAIQWALCTSASINLRLRARDRRWDYTREGEKLCRISGGRKNDGQNEEYTRARWLWHIEPGDLAEKCCEAREREKLCFLFSSISEGQTLVAYYGLLTRVRCWKGPL